MTKRAYAFSSFSKYPGKASAELLKPLFEKIDIRLVAHSRPFFFSLDEMHRTSAFVEGRRYIVHSDELLSAFMELEATLL